MPRPTSTYSPLSDAMLEDPYPTYARLLADEPIAWHEQMNSWVAVRHGDCQRILRDWSAFARDRRRLGIEIPEFVENLQSLDPPHQAPLRSAVMRSLRNQDLDRLRAEAVADTVAFLDGARGDEVEWIRDFAAPFSLTATASLIGVPAPDLDTYLDLSEAIAYRMDSGLHGDDVKDAGDSARLRLREIVETWHDAVDENGVHAQVLAQSATAGIPENYIRNTLGVLFNASFGTLYAALGNLLYTLHRHPEVLTHIAEHRCFDSAADELIRFDGPAQGTSRIAVADVEICGQPISAGDTVITLTAAANRDPAVFAAPQRLDPDRQPNPHLGFGWGPHSCVGSLFGKIAIAGMLEGLGDRLPELVGSPVRRATATVRSIERLDVVVGRAATAVAGR